MAQAQVENRRAEATAVRVGVWNIAWGVFLGGLLLSVAGLAVAAVFWMFNVSQMNARLAQEEAARKADQRVSSQFYQGAAKFVADIDAEYSAANRGSKSYSAAHSTVDNDYYALLGSAKTSREKDLVIEIDDAESTFNICAGAALGSFGGGSLKDCFAQYPQSQVDAVLAKQDNPSK